MTTQTELTASKSPTSVDPATYNRLVAAARLRDLRLVKSDFSMEAEAVKFSPDWKIKHECEIQGIELAPDRDLLLIWIAAGATCKQGNKKIISVKCRYLVAYDMHGEFSDDAANAFAKRVARFAAYPYFRSHFAELTSQAGLHLPPLPVIKEVKLLPPEPETTKAIEGNKEQ